MTPTTWQIVGRWCWLKADRLRQDWNDETPHRGELPPPRIESAIDCWCARLAREPDRPQETSDELKPWILARLLFAGALGQTMQDLTEIPPPADMRSGLETLLIAEWCAQGRDQWADLPLA